MNLEQRSFFNTNKFLESCFIRKFKNCLLPFNQIKATKKDTEADPGMFSTFRSSLRYPYQADVSSVLTDVIAASVNKICVIHKYPGHVIVWF